MSKRNRRRRRRIADGTPQTLYNPLSSGSASCERFASEQGPPANGLATNSGAGPQPPTSCCCARSLGEPTATAHPTTAALDAQCDRRSHDAMSCCLSASAQPQPAAAEHRAVSELQRPVTAPSTHPTLSAQGTTAPDESKHFAASTYGEQSVQAASTLPALPAWGEQSALAAPRPPAPFAAWGQPGAATAKPLAPAPWEQLTMLADVGAEAVHTGYPTYVAPTDTVGLRSVGASLRRWMANIFLLRFEAPVGILRSICRSPNVPWKASRVGRSAAHHRRRCFARGGHWRPGQPPEAQGRLLTFQRRLWAQSPANPSARARPWSLSCSGLHAIRHSRRFVLPLIR